MIPSVRLFMFFEAAAFIAAALIHFGLPREGEDVAEPEPAMPGVREAVN